MTVPPPNRVEFCKTQVTLLESLFGPDWFTKSSRATKKHPAYQRWVICNDIVSRGGVLRVPEQLRSFAEITLDNEIVVLCSHGDTHSFRMDDMSNYGHPDVVNRIRSMIVTTEGFSSIMTELSYAAWNLSHGHAVKAHHLPGVADFEVSVPGFELPVIADCKHLAADSSASRLGKDLSKANSQIKALGQECFGLAVINVSEKVNKPARWARETPDDLKRLIERTDQLLRKQNTTLSGALLIWADYFVEPIPDSIPRFHVVLQLRSELVRHRQPIHVLPSVTTAIEFGFTSEFTIR